MTGVLEINGKQMCPIRDAVRSVSYSRDYITKLARDEKIRATHVGRNWYVDLDSLKSYAESASIEHQIRKKKLSDERIHERNLRIEKEKYENLLNNKAAKGHRHAVVAAALVLATGALGGALASKLLGEIEGSLAQVASSQNKVQELLPTSAADFAVTESASRQKLPDNYYSVETKKLSTFDNGILILPQSGERLSSTSAKGVFSDEVLVRESEAGVLEAVRIGVEGNEMGESLPVVIVPVNEEKL